MWKMLCSGVALVLLATPATMADERGYYSQPDVNGDRLVFVSEGDLWTATIPGDDRPVVAHRLTSHDGDETRPHFSPDGSNIAFTAHYDGNTDVYIMPFDGGRPKRLTFHPGDDVAVAWSADGRSVLFRSARRQPLGRTELWSISVDGGMPERFDLGECSMASLNRGGKLIAFNRWSNEHWTWKGYRGGAAPDIWIGEFRSGRFWRLAPNDANDLFPMWIRGRVYFLSDRGGPSAIYSDVPTGGDLRKHTDFAPESGSGRASGPLSQSGPEKPLGAGHDRIQRLDSVLA